MHWGLSENLFEEKKNWIIQNIMWLSKVVVNRVAHAMAGILVWWHQKFFYVVKEKLLFLVSSFTFLQATIFYFESSDFFFFVGNLAK